jgi:hypothetical protein
MLPQRFKRFAVLLTDHTSRLMERVVSGFHVLNKMFFLLILLIACRAFLSVMCTKLAIFKQPYAKKQLYLKIMLSNMGHGRAMVDIGGRFWPL